MPVITAFEFDYAIATGEPARHTYRAHRGFGPRARQTYPLNRRKRRCNLSSELDLQLGWRAVACSARDGFANGFDNNRMRVAKYHWSPRPDVIDVTVAIHIHDVSPGGLANEDRRAANRAKCPDRAIDPARNQLLGSIKKIIGPGGVEF